MLKRWLSDIDGGLLLPPVKVSRSLRILTGSALACDTQMETLGAGRDSRQWERAQGVGVLLDQTH